MKKIYLILTLLVVALYGCKEHEPDAPMLEVESWDIPVGLSSASSVVWGDTLFVLFGRDTESAIEPHPYCYAISLDDPTVVRRFSLPIPPRVKAAGILVGNRYYCGLGFKGKVYDEGADRIDWWCWNLENRTVTRLADMISVATNSPVTWSCGDSIFISMCYYSNNFPQHTYRYSINENEWTMVNEFSMHMPRAAAAGAVADGRMFAGGGFSVYMLNDWLEFNPNTYFWDARTPMPTRGRMFASAASSGQTVYVIGGRFFGGTETTEHFYSSILAYNAANDSWKILGYAPEAAEHQIAFWHNGYLYWGLGQDGNKNMIRKLYRYRP